MIPKIREILKNNENIVRTYDKFKEFYYRHVISDEELIRKKFKKRLGREVELENPIKFNDKLQWLKLNWHDPVATKCADKYEVREIIKEKIGEEYLNELIGVYESVDEIDIDKLPDKFVLKGTHGSGFNIICKDKSKMNWDEEFKKMRRWLRTNYYLQNREWVYKDQKPRIICEKYLEEKEVGQLRDYKFHCFNGEPKFIQVDFDRFQNHKKNIYDTNWNLIEVEFNYPYDNSISIEKPKKFEEMKKLSKILSNDFPYSRIDFYYLNHTIIFGEITFFPASGMGPFNPKEFETTMDSWLELPIANGGNQ